MSEQEITKEEYLAWKDNKVTRAFMALLSDSRNELAATLTSGGTLGEQTAINTAHCVGYIKGISEILDYEMELPEAYEH
jgi:hypothetical protein